MTSGIKMKSKHMVKLSRGPKKIEDNISDKLRVKLLNEKVSECLHIKDLLITDKSRPDSSFPELSLKEEEMVKNALDNGQPVSETLVSKFNMNITRQRCSIVISKSISFNSSPSSVLISVSSTVGSIFSVIRTCTHSNILVYL